MEAIDFDIVEITHYIHHFSGNAAFWVDFSIGQSSLGMVKN